jgi:hypothetical protein
VHAIDLKAVPKAHDKARTIAPDTTIGGFLSRGLGSYIRAKLESGTSIKLSIQQDLHKFLAKLASLDGFNGTLDMKKASDSFVRDHLASLLPASWMPACDVVHFDKFLITWENTEESALCYGLRSQMLMGSGHTFPLQTLLFYSLCKAVVELSGSRARVNVYGDDIIMPAKYCERAIICLSELGFTINRDKSFWTDHFRESCGGDFHTGVDVRPFMLEIDTTVQLSHLQYVALHHKIANGLMERWSMEEIPETYHFILTHLLVLDKRINVVPFSEGADAGIKFVPPAFKTLVQWPSPLYSEAGVNTWLTSYVALREKAKKRRPRFERIYYWYALRPHGITDPYEDVSASRLDKAGAENMKGSHRYGWVATNH